MFLREYARLQCREQDQWQQLQLAVFDRTFHLMWRDLYVSQLQSKR